MTPQELRAHRATNNLSQGQLGQRLGVSQRVVSSWETGRTPIPTDLAERLVVPMNPEQLSHAKAVIGQALDWLRAKRIASEDVIRLALRQLADKN